MKAEVQEAAVSSVVRAETLEITMSSFPEARTALWIQFSISEALETSTTIP